MSDIKFACPHCAQHIACDSLYCGERIQCPGCKGTLYVPPLAAAIPLKAGGISLEVPVAAKERVHPSTVQTRAWTEAAWVQHTSELGVPPETPLWAFLVAPVFLALILLSFHVGPSWILPGFVVLALGAGFYAARRQCGWTGATLLRGILYSLAAAAAYTILAVGIVFVGCLACH